MKRVSLLMLLALVCSSPATAGWHSLASFQGRESKVTRFYTFNKPWRVRWECRRQHFDTLYFSLTAVSADSPTRQFLLANETKQRSAISHTLPAGTYRFETIAAITWYQFQVEEWSGSRVWTSSDGRTIEAEYVSSTTTHVRIRRTSDDQVFDYEIAKLSEADREWVAKAQGD